MKKKFKKFYPFSFQQVSNNNVYKLLKNINANKAIGCDLIPLKLVKIATDQLLTVSFETKPKKLLLYQLIKGEMLNVYFQTLYD